MKTKSSIRILTTSAAALLGVVGFNQSAKAQAISITGPMTYLQNFDSLGNPATNPAWADNTTLPGWYAQINNAAPAGADGQVKVTNGVAALNGLLNMGTTAAVDRALGSKTTGTVANIGYGVLLQNTSASPLRVTSVGYTAELWRSNSTAAPGNAELLGVSFKTGAAPITNVESGASGDLPALGTFSALAALDASVVGTAGGVQLDGNLAANRVVKSLANAGVTIAAGGYFMLRFVDSNRATGTDGFIGVDDLSITFAAAARNLTYNLSHTVGGAPNGIWETTSNYWLDIATPTAFATAEDVTFSQNPATTATVDVPAAISAGTITVSHASGTYLIGGAGTVSGALVKNGAGNLSLTSNNTFSSSSISGGTITTSAATPFGTAAVTIAGPTDLVASSDLSVGGFAGAGALTKTGAGNLTTTAISATTGTVNVNGGKLIIGSNAGFSSTTSTINIAGTALDATPNATTTIAGNVNFNNVAGTTITTIAATETGLSATGLDFSKASGITTAGPLTKAGLGILRVTAAQATTSNWNVTQGFLETTNATGFGTGSLNVTGGWVSIAGGVTITNPITLAGGGLGVKNGAPAAPVETYAGPVSVTADSFLTPKRTSTFANYNGYFITGALSGSNSLTVTGPIVAALLVAPFTPQNTPVNPSLAATTNTVGAVTLTNVANAFSGAFIVNSQQIISGLPAGGTGDVFGTSTFTLKGGAVRILDNGTGNNGNLTYNHAITVAAPNDAVNPGVATVFVDRQTGPASASNLSTPGTFTGNTVVFPSLAIPGGQGFRTEGANSYGVRITAPVAATGTGDVTFNAGTAPLDLSSGFSGTVNLVKQGVGTLKVNGASHSGNTTVSAGTLELTNVGGLAVTVGQTLAGAGTVTGPLSVNGATVIPGNATGVGTLTLSNFTVGNSAIQYSWNAGTLGSINVINTDAFVPTVPVTLNFLGQTPNVGTHTLIDYAGTPITNLLSIFSVGSMFPRIDYTLSNDTAQTRLDLIVNGVKSAIWSGGNSTEWSTNVIAAPKNWNLSGGGADDFITDDKVVFDNNAVAAAPTVDISVANVTPKSVEVTGSKNYTFQGTAAIAGITTLEMNGTGRLTISNPNSFTGAVNLNSSGTISVSSVENSGTASPLGAGTTVNINNGGTLEFTGAAGSTNRAITLGAAGGSVSATTGTLTLAGVVGGAGTLEKKGLGSVVLTGATNALTAVTISAGTLQVGDGVAAGSLGATATVANNATLAFNTIAAGILVPNTITGTGGLTVAGAGNVTLNGAAVANTFTGNTVVNSGGLVFSHATATNSIGGNLIVNGGTVNYGATAGQIADHIPATASITVNGGTFGGTAGRTVDNPLTGLTETAASLSISGGTFLSGRSDAGTFALSGAFNATGGTTIVQRGGSVTAASITLGSGATVSFDGGSTGFASRLFVGASGLTLAGATINLNAGPSAIGATSQGSLIVLGGNVAVTASTTLNRVNTTELAPRAGFDVNGADRAFNVAAGTTLTLGTIAAPVSIANTLAATTAGIDKKGDGNMIISGNSTYNGATTVSGGTLTLIGTLSGTTGIDVQTSAVFDVSGVVGGYTLGATQLLKGTGTVVGAGTTTIAGKISPGASPGTLTFALGGGTLDVTPAVTPSASAALIFELGTSSDRVVLNAGSLNIGTGVLEFNDFLFTDSGGLAETDYVLFDGTSAIAGSLGAGVSGAIGAFTGELQFADGGNDLILHVVPEPGSVALLVLGSALLFRRRRQA